MNCGECDETFVCAQVGVPCIRLALPAAPAPADMVMVPRKELGDGISLLHQAMVGACDCLTKTHEAKYHAENCFYRKLSAQCDKLEATLAAAPAPAVPADAAMTLLKELRHALEPISAYGRVGTRDVEQAKLQHLVAMIDRVLSAAPAVREPLTDAQIDKIFDDAHENMPKGELFRTFVTRAIERAHGIGGGGDHG